jgi:hypothetical protein
MIRAASGICQHTKVIVRQQLSCRLQLLQGY